MTVFLHRGQTRTGPLHYSKFMAKWDTTKEGSANDTIVLPLVADGTYDFYIDWGDGNKDTITGYDQSEVTHQYSNTGIYTIQLVANDMVGWQFNDSGDDDKLVEIIEWGPLRFVSDDTNLFKGCSNLTLSTTSNPPFNTDAAGMFQDCSSLTGTGGNIMYWDMSSVTGMNFMLAGCSTLDVDLSNWDVTSIENAEGFMSGAGLSTMNYDRILSGWSLQAVQSGVTISFGDTKVSEVTGQAYKNALVSSGWTILDGGVLLPSMPKFVTTWDTTRTDSTYSPSNTVVRFPLVSQGSYDFYIDWGDGTAEQNITSYSDSNKDHTYSSPGIYTVTVTGQISGLHGRDGNGGDARVKLVSIDQMDNLQLLNPSDSATLSEGVFAYLTSLTGLPGDFLDVGPSGSVKTMFAHSTGLGSQSIPQVSGWDVSKVKTMQQFFVGLINFNENISPWDVSNVTNFEDCFNGCDSFNNGGSSGINNWSPSSATSFQSMFANCDSFNQPVGGWDTSNVTDMINMFRTCPSFNNGGSSNISGWDTSSVTNMLRMFQGATSFNQPIGSWDTSNVAATDYMFADATAFNQPIGSWDMSNNYGMHNMFNSASSFNQNIGSWDTSNVQFMYRMFYGATSFDQNLGNWDIGNVLSIYQFFDNNHGLSTSNYNNTLIGWAPQSVNAVSISFGNSRYSAGAAASARATLVSKGWTITDGGQV